ncbi:Apolipoprotein N-acyltransferase [Posidoniimonas polymericola]|uniref:Apolipoprotein N-acyltransferase n=1 Tax=Posidoniimonas polymericola TaxID=2528002 RepID=A0A5C5YI59_9BACT|nr:apolipoprotein N-acyltransferase [Posidoniimonas polymericola]TWT74432.1 Apolipoprotein N-acyltransferase [Posidoniimonas polymericola]
MPPDASSPAERSDAAPQAKQPWRRSPLAVMLLGGVLVWLSQPGTARMFGLENLPWGLLGWAAAAPWIALVLRPEPLSRWGCVQVWLGGVAYWLLLLYWICYPHPLTPIGWPLLAGYLGVYPLAFVLISRRVVHRGGAPVWVAAPIVWAALEFVQAHLFTGFLMGALSHTQARLPLVIQISDTAGAYGVSFVLMMSAACVAVLLDRNSHQQRRVAAAATTAATALAVLYYGFVRINDDTATRPGPSVALIQGDTRATWDPSEGRDQRILDAQLRVTRQAAKAAGEAGRPVDLFIWPESMFRAPVVTLANRPTPTTELPELYQRFGRAAEEWFGGLAAEQGAAFLLGVDRFDLTKSDTAETGYDQTIYNTAALVDHEGHATAFYDKTHRVPFGEYIPFAENMPGLYFLTPMSGGLGEGAGPVSMPLETSIGPVLLAPNICYETVIPHVIRRQVAELTAAGKAPDLLVNITNDAWFWGASELDLHLACGQFRAVENRTPMVIAANTGLSAVVDSSGRVRNLTRRMQEDFIVAAPALDGRSSFYSRHGDWFALGCLAGTVVLLLLSCSKGDGGMGKAASTAEARQQE